MQKYITALIGTTAISALATTQAHAATTHTVKSGESVWSISHKYGISIAKLKSLNGLTSNLIFLIKYLKYQDHHLARQNLRHHLIVVQCTL